MIVLNKMAELRASDWLCPYTLLLILVWGGFMVRLIGTGGSEVVILIVVSH